MALAYNTLHSGGNIGGTAQLIIHLYPNHWGLDDECETTIANALDDAGSQMVGYYDSPIDYYEIKISYNHPNINGGNRHDYYTNFKNWFFSSVYDGVFGVHMGIAGDFSGGFASGGDGSDPSAFSGDSKPAVMGTMQPAERFKTTAIQECLHPCIDAHLVDHLHNGNEHDVGVVYDDGSASPMAAGYVSRTNNNGVCQSGNWWFGFYDTDLTSCTKQAVKETADHDA